jgi:hypothetical protein
MATKKLTKKSDIFKSSGKLAKPTTAKKPQKKPKEKNQTIASTDEDSALRIVAQARRSISREVAGLFEKASRMIVTVETREGYFERTGLFLPALKREELHKVEIEGAGGISISYFIPICVPPRVISGSFNIAIKKLGFRIRKVDWDTYWKLSKRRPTRENAIALCDRTKTTPSGKILLLDKYDKKYWGLLYQFRIANSKAQKILAGQKGDPKMLKKLLAALPQEDPMDFS